MNRPTGGSAGTPGRNVPRATGTTAERAVRRQNAERFFRDLVSEMRRVTWPTRPEWVSATVLTIGLVVVIGLYTYLADELFGYIFGLLTHH
ncbi:MAG: preprotein translocase subunit SecE [Candidatus Eremiobacteraeota bacterium]|nr:preprotein translocase subunit SecE [Candidatus Eremiobacteraeota bacterium]